MFRCLGLVVLLLALVFPQVISAEVFNGILYTMEQIEGIIALDVLKVYPSELAPFSTPLEKKRFLESGRGKMLAQELKWLKSTLENYGLTVIVKTWDGTGVSGGSLGKYDPQKQGFPVLLGSDYYESFLGSGMNKDGSPFVFPGSFFGMLSPKFRVEKASRTLRGFVLSDYTMLLPVSEQAGASIDSGGSLSLAVTIILKKVTKKDTDLVEMLSEVPQKMLKTQFTLWEVDPQAMYLLKPPVLGVAGQGTGSEVLATIPLQ